MLEEIDPITLFGLKVFILLGLGIAFFILIFKLLRIMPADLWGWNKK
jgi:hypothetical protein